MYIYKYEILAHFNLAVAKVDRQIAKFSGYTVLTKLINISKIMFGPLLASIQLLVYVI